MIPNFTTYDRIWLLGGLTSMVLLFLFFGWMHPEKNLGDGLNKKDISIAVNNQFALLFGISSINENFTPNLKKRSSLLDGFVQTHGKKQLRETINNYDGDFLFYYWDIKPNENQEFDLTALSGFPEDITDVPISQSGNATINFTFSRLGEMITLKADTTLISINRKIIEDDSLFSQRAIDLFKNSVWHKYNPQFQDVSYTSEESSSFKRYLAHARFNANVKDVDVVLTVQMNDNGDYKEFSYSLTNAPSIPGYGQAVVNGFRGFVIFILIVILIGIFLRRLFLRLVDIKMVYPDALFFGLLILIITLLASYQDLVQNIDDILPLIAAVVLVPIAAGIGALILAAPVFATADSLAQEAWPRKKYTITLLRYGFFNNNLVGSSLVRGVIAGMIIAGIFSILFLLFDKAWLIDQSNAVFLSDDTLLAFVFYTLNPLVLAIIISIIMISLPASWLKLRNTKEWILVAAVLLITGLFSNIMPHTGNYYINLILYIVLMAIPFFMFMKYDILTTLISLFIAGLSINIVLSLITPGLTDILITCTGVGVILLILIFGFVGSSKTNDLSTLPDLTPEYIKKMAREQRIERELELAREVHTSFLSSSKPNISGFDIAANCKTAYEVGGDYYDFIPLTPTQTLVVIADVSGKGVKAAFYMTLIKGYLQSMAEHHKKPDEILKQVNRLFYENSPRGTFITALAAVIDSDAKTISFARAGHDPLILLKDEKAEPQVYQPNGFALGMTKTDTFNEYLELETFELGVNETVVLFTDGYPESFNMNRVQLGDERFLSILKSHVNKKTSSINYLNSVQQDVLRFSAQTQQHDDMTMIVIKRIV